MLTKKQRDLLLFIHDRMRQGDIAPSFDEMRTALGLQSKSGIHRLVTALVERGYLERLPHRARALEVKKLPEGFTPELDDTSAAANQTRSTNDVYAITAMQSIPLFGKIAAGTPIEAIRHEDQQLDIPASLLSRGEHYALEVDGESMIKAGINDGDTVVIQKCEDAQNGAIVVALVDGEEVTLKRIEKKGSEITLIPENDDHEPRTLSADRVQVQGKLVSLFRTYH